MAGSDAPPAVDAFRTARPLPEMAGLVFRHLRAPDDYPQMNAIANATRVATGDDFTTTDEQIRSFYEHPRDFDAARDVAVVEVNRRVVGYVRGGIHQELSGPRVYEVLPFLDPSVSPAELLPLMLSAMEDHLRELAATDPDGENVLQTFGGDSAPEGQAGTRQPGPPGERGQISAGGLLGRFRSSGGPSGPFADAMSCTNASGETRRHGQSGAPNLA